jgi:FkbM family methyltransferase
VTELLEMRGGLLWPRADTEAFHWIAEVEHDVPGWVAGHCRQRRTIIQAGGNCGLYPIQYARLFEEVHTFEPDPLNFRCLVHNVPAENVHFYRSALSDQAGDGVSMVGGDRNCGAKATARGGRIRTLRIDDLNLGNVGCIHLDIEGDEMVALHGAKATLQRCRPVVVIEINERCVERGLTYGSIVRRVEAFGYRWQDVLHQNHLFLPDF